MGFFGRGTTRIVASEMPAGWTHGEAVVNGVRLHYVEVGSLVVLLLHGFA
jgi:hypothetical protein